MDSMIRRVMFDGKMLDKRWELKETVGKGQYGFVHLANDLTKEEEDPKRKVAVKFIFKGKCRKEVTLHRMLKHKNIIEMIDTMCITLNSKPMICIVMEYANSPHRTLQHRIKASPINREESDGVIKQLVDGLTYMHAQDIIHGDIKPANILIGAHNIIKICDMGSSRKVKDENGHVIRFQNTFGTSCYMAPEAYQRLERDGPPTDVWALGIVVIYLLSRVKPWLWPCPKDNRFACWKRNPSLFYQRNYKIDSHLDVIEMCLLYNPEERSSMEQIKSHLEQH